MALPSIKNATFSLRIKEFPKPIQIRPMIVSEHKTIQQVIDIGSENDIASTIADVTRSCTNGKVDGNSVAQYILDFIFLQIYMTSVENVVSSTYSCYHYLKNEDNGDILYDEETGDPILCDNEIEVKIPLANASIIYPEEYEELRKVKINDSVTLVLKNLSLNQNIEISDNRLKIIELLQELSDLDENKDSKENDQKIEEVNKTINDLRAELKDHYTYLSVESILNGENISYPEQDFNEAEFIEWLNTCPSMAVSKVDNFFDSAPIVGMDIKITCPKCMNSSDIKLRGLKDFF